MYKSYASKYTQVHIDTVIQSSGSYEGGLSGEVPLGRRRIHGHPPAQFGALVCNITRLCTNHAQKVFLTVGTNVYIYAHSCTKLAEKVLLTKTPPPPPHSETKTVAHLGKRPKYISMLGGMGGVSIVRTIVIIVIISITLISTWQTNI